MSDDTSGFNVDFDEFGGLDEAIQEQNVEPADPDAVFNPEDFPTADNSDLEAPAPTEDDVMPIGERFSMGEGSGYATRNADGSITYEDPDGSVYTKNPSGTYTTEWAGQKYTYDPAQEGFVDDKGVLIKGGVNTPVTGGGAKGLLDKVKDSISKNPFAALTTAAAAAKIMSGTNSAQSRGYQGSIPKLEGIRQVLQYNDENRRPGERGRQYFTDMQYVTQGDEAAKAAALQKAATQAQGIAALQPASQPKANPWAGKMNLSALTPASRQAAAEETQVSLPQIPQAQPLQAAPSPAIQEEQPEQKMAHGGIANLAKGGRYLSGRTDGMADKINTSIDGTQPAKLSHGEFVIPADVVSHLGNGNSEAGADKLYQMMARIRQARTGNPKQGKRINPDKFMPGGIVGLAGGGEVKGFDGTTGSTVTNTGTSAGGVPLDRSTTSSLSPWAGEYVTNALGQGAALAAQPYQAYTGPLTAGASNLQQQAFAGASDLAATGYTPTTFSAGTFDAAAANKYMNPYLSAALNPSLDEARRQAQISRLEDAGRLTKAGAYGGGRQAIMESELNRNLMEKQNKMLGEGYANAYDKAVAQFNAEQNRGLDVQKADEASRQYGADFGIKSLNQLAAMGETERGIEQAGITADKQQFEEQRDWAYKMPQYQLDLLKNLPIKTETSGVDQDTLSKLQSDIAGLASLYGTLSKLGVTPG